MNYFLQNYGQFETAVSYEQAIPRFLFPTLH